MKRLLALSMICCLGMTSGALAQATAAPAKPADKAAQPKPAEKPAAKPAEKMSDKKDDKGADAMKAMEEAWAKAGEPGKYHEWMKQLEGDWEAAVTEYGMDGTKTESKGTMESEIIFGGRFLKNSFKGRMNNKFFYGAGMMGYNNVDKRFESTWADSMSSNISLMTGSADAAGKVLTLSGECPNPMGGKMKQREVTTIVDKNTHKMEFYGDMGKGEMKMMEITFTRAGKGDKKEMKEDKKDAKDDKKDKGH